ncbi:MAG TPA: hypothetical protein VNN80_35780 [Polyangiaceae bacterium]|nr:hypothetical protein [Polyangiaceae bacterium]
MRHQHAAPSCSLRQALLVTAAAALALSPARAMANCAFEPRITFSYPSEGTQEVPLDAVFWAVPESGAVSFRLDGVELQHLGDSLEGRFQFAPAEALSPGIHDIEISVDAQFEGQPLEGETLRFRVEAVEQAPVEADATIEAVTYYPAVIVDGFVSYPTLDESGAGCAWSASLTQVCEDIIPENVTRIDFSTRGDAIGYLVEGTILAPDCRVDFPYEYSAGVRAPYTIQAVLPTGLSAARVFEGTARGMESVASAGAAEQASAEAPPRALRRAKPEAADSCAIHSPANGTSAPSLFWLAAAGAVALRLRRR